MKQAALPRFYGAKLAINRVSHPAMQVHDRVF